MKEKRTKPDRRYYERRTCIIVSKNNRRYMIDRRQIIRRDDERATKRRRGFWRDQRKERILRDMRQRQRRIKERLPYSWARIIAARQKALDLIYKNQGFLNKTICQRNINLIKSLLKTTSETESTSYFTQTITKEKEDTYLNNIKKQ
jgi:hypothetical protein